MGIITIIIINTILVYIYPQFLKQINFKEPMTGLGKILS